MKKPSLLIIVSSLLIGGVLTALLLGQMSWRTYANYNCQVSGSTAKTEGCAIMEYGYPSRFITSDVNVGEQNVVFATTQFNKTNLAMNWLTLSGFSFVVLYLVSTQLKTSPQAKKGLKTKR